MNPLARRVVQRNSSSPRFRIFQRPHTTIVVVSASVGLLMPLAHSAHAAPFTSGDLVVMRVGAGGSALTSAATAVFLDEYSASGTLVQSIALPTAASGNNNPFTNSGVATSEGALALSPNGQYLTLGGYAATPGVVNIPATRSPINAQTGAANPGTPTARVIALVGADGIVNTSTTLTNAYDGSNIRAVVTTDGNSFYTAGAGGTLDGPSGGVRLANAGSNSTTASVSAGSNINYRVTNIFNNQLYASTGAGTLGIYAIGNGLPAASSAVTDITPQYSGLSPYGFYFADPNTLYVADSSKGLYKFAKLSTDTVFSGTGTLISSTGITGLTGSTVNGVTTLYATNGTNLLELQDNGGTGQVFNTLVTATSNEAFRGLAFAPSVAAVPEAGTMLSLAVGLGC